ncbi:hypothetical protein ACMGDM_20305 [Sphingomonas sp. DT-51]|uniref:hypothetical protein n=1 Tax=Sphingomonas sp. DT-51 TaxID=3396165 RepID=UPI003F1E1764
MTANEIVTASIAGGSLFVSIISAIIAWQQAKVVRRKIGMVTDPTRMTEILPVWYVERMAQDQWGFGLLLASGEILAISRILGVSDDQKWMEVDLLDRQSGPLDVSGMPVLYAPHSNRTRSSVRVDQVQAAFELWDS